MKPCRPPRTCDIDGCDVVVRRGILMCRPHWYATPRPLRLAIGQAWREQRYKDWIVNRAEARRWHAATPPTPDRAPNWSGIDLSHPEAREL